MARRWLRKAGAGGRPKGGVTPTRGCRRGVAVLLPQLVTGLVLLTLVLSPPSASAAEILAVVSTRHPAYEAVLSRIRAGLARLPAVGPKAIQPHTLSVVYLDEAGEAGLRRQARARPPDAVVALGRSALFSAVELSDRLPAPALPVVHVLAPAVPAAVRGRSHVTGLTLDPSPATVLSRLRDLLPGLARIGLVHDPSRTSALAEEALRAAQQLGVTLTVLPVREAREVPMRLTELRGRVDALWLPPDLTVAAPNAVASLVLFPEEHRVPVVAFARIYLERGAPLAVEADLSGMAEQAVRMVRRILAGESPANIPPEVPDRVVVTANRRRPARPRAVAAGTRAPGVGGVG